MFAIANIVETDCETPRKSLRRGLGSLFDDLHARCRRRRRRHRQLAATPPPFFLLDTSTSKEKKTAVVRAHGTRIHDLTTTRRVSR